MSLMTLAMCIWKRRLGKSLILGEYGASPLPVCPDVNYAKLTTSAFRDPRLP